MNRYAAKYALDLVTEHWSGDVVGKQHVLDSLKRLADGTNVAVPASSLEAKIGDLYRQLETVRVILGRADPTYEEYRGVIEAAIAYIDGISKGRTL